MAVTSDPYTASDLAAMINEVWSPIVNEPNFPKAVLSNFCIDLSDYMAEGGDICHVPNIYTNTFSVQNQTTQGAEITTESVAQVDTTLTVSLHKYIAWIIGDKDMKQLAKKYELNVKYANEAKGLLTQALEDSLFGLWSSLSTNTVGDTATVLTDLEIRQAVEKLDALDYDLNECALFFHPFVYWNQLGGVAKYYTYNISLQDFIRTGNFGKSDASRGLRGVFYGIPAFVSSRVVSGLSTYRNLFLHKSCFGFAIQTNGEVAGQMGPNPVRIRVQAENALRNLGLLTVCDIIYGVGVLREAAGCVINANTTATQS